MSILTTIDGLPLFDSVIEAENWAIANGLQGFHQHLYEGQIGYMGGSSHDSVANPQAASVVDPVSTDPIVATPPVTPPVTTPVATPVTLPEDDEEDNNIY